VSHGLCGTLLLAEGWFGVCCALFTGTEEGGVEGGACWD